VSVLNEEVDVARTPVGPETVAAIL
jgi:hypothetical protein